MRRIFSLLLTFIILITSTAHAEINISFPDDEDSVKINVTLPDKYIDNYMSIAVFNPGKTADDVDISTIGNAFQFVDRTIYSGAGAEFNFKVNRELFEESLKPHFKAVVTARDYTEELDFSVYTSDDKAKLIEKVNNLTAASSEIATITDDIADVFNISFDIYKNASDKSEIAKKIISILDSENIAATESNIGNILKQAAVLQAIEASDISLISEKTVNASDIIGISSAFQSAVNNISDTGIAEINAAAANKSYNNIAELKAEAENNIAVNAIYSNNELGYGHVSDIISSLSDYFEENGLDFDKYNNSSKSEVAKELISAGKLDFESMIAKINSLASESKGSGSSSSSGGSGGGSSSKSGVTIGNVSAPAKQSEGLIDLDDAPWAKSCIQSLYNAGIVSGSGDGYFYPQNSITRAEFTKMIVEAFAITGGDGVHFSDVNEADWFYSYIKRGVGAEIIFGDGVNFYPNDKIKRQDIAVIAFRALTHAGVIINDLGTEMSFADSDTISEYAYESVKLLNQQGVINGSDNLVKPLDNATRAEASVILSGILDLYKNGAKTTASAPAVSAPADNIEQTTISSAEDEMVSVLVRTGVIAQSDISELTAVVTKGSLAKMLTSYAGMKGQIKALNQKPFDDVELDNEYAPYIKLMTDYGYMAAENGNNFEPNKPVTTGEVLRSVVSILGYGLTVEDFSDINAYYNIASSLDLTDGLNVGISQYVTEYDAMRIFYNSLDTEVMKLNYGSNGEKIEKGDIYLTEFHDIYSVKGVMNANAVTSINSSLSPSKNKIYLDSIPYYTDDDLYYMNDYLGYYIEVFYDEESNVKACRKLKNNELVISDAEIESYSDGRLYYIPTGSEKTKSVSLADGAVIVYNGVVKENYTTDIFNIESGSIELVAAKSEEYDVVKIYSYETMVANGVSAENKAIYPENGEVIYLEEYTSVVIRNELANYTDVSRIGNGNILSVAESEDGSAIIINYSTKSVSGLLKSVDTSENKCIIDGTEYDFLDIAKLSGNDIGTSGTFYLDYKGRIAKAVYGVSSRWNYAYLIKASYDDAVDSLVIKYMDDTGKISTVEQENGLWVDGEERFGNEFLDCFKYNISMEKQDNIVAQLIKVQYNSEGKFTRIDTAYRDAGENDTSLSVNNTAYSNQRVYKTDTRRLFEHRNSLTPYTENAMRLDENTVIFSVPMDAEIATAADDDFKILPLSSFTNSQVLKHIWAYDTDYLNGDLVGAICYKGASGADNYAELMNLFVVTQVTEGLNSDDEAVTAVYGYDYKSLSWKTLVSHSKEDLLKDVGVGDIFRYTPNSNGEIFLLDHDFDYSAAGVGWAYTPPSPSNRGNWTGAPEVAEAYGVFTHKNGNWVNFTKSIQKENGEIVRGNMTYDMTNTKVLLFDTGSGKVISTGSQEIGEYIYNINPDARVWIYTSFGTLYACVIYI